MNEAMIKTDAEIDFMRESGKLLAQVFKMLDDFICEGMTFTIEPMINQGSQKVKTKKDGWTVVTRDKKLSAQWEHTILVTETGFEVLTLRDDEKAFL